MDEGCLSSELYWIVQTTVHKLGSNLYDMVPTRVTSVVLIQFFFFLSTSKDQVLIDIFIKWKLQNQSLKTKPRYELQKL